jgi:hypothetical protein
MGKHLIFSAACCLVLTINCGGPEIEPNRDGSPTPGACVDSNNGCNENLDCPAQEVCIKEIHTCRCAYGLQYEFTVLATKVYQRTESGLCWDPGTIVDGLLSCENDLPDPYYVLTVDGQDFVSPAQENDVTSYWAGSSHVVTVNGNSTYGAALYDQDGAQDSEDVRDRDNNDVEATTDGELDECIMHATPMFPFTLQHLRNSGIAIADTLPSGEDRHHIRFTLNAIP